MEIYATKPAAVEVYPVEGPATDVILRKNIEEIPVQLTAEDDQTDQTAWQCEEVQYRYAGTLTAEEVEADFDTWWEYTPTSDIDDESEETSIEQQITDLQVALCEVYELLSAE